MARAVIKAGICGFSAAIEARMNGTGCMLSIQSQCELIQQLAEKLPQVDPFEAVGVAGRHSCVLRIAAGLCHAACPVPAGIVKAVEVEAGLALPADASIRVSKSE